VKLKALIKGEKVGGIVYAKFDKGEETRAREGKGFAKADRKNSRAKRGTFRLNLRGCEQC